MKLNLEAVLRKLALKPGSLVVFKAAATVDYKLEVTSSQSKVLPAVTADRLCCTSALSEHFNNSSMQGLQVPRSVMCFHTH